MQRVTPKQYVVLGPVEPQPCTILVVSFDDPILRFLLHSFIFFGRHVPVEVGMYRLAEVVDRHIRSGPWLDAYHSHRAFRDDAHGTDRRNCVGFPLESGMQSILRCPWLTWQRIIARSGDNPDSVHIEVSADGGYTLENLLRVTRSYVLRISFIFKKFVTFRATFLRSNVRRMSLQYGANGSASRHTCLIFVTLLAGTIFEGTVSMLRNSTVTAPYHRIYLQNTLLHRDPVLRCSHPAFVHELS